jgi:hypothetical protein
MPGGRWRGKYNQRKNAGLPIKKPTRLGRVVSATQPVYRANTANLSQSNTVAVTVNFGEDVVFIPPGNNYMANNPNLGPYLWCSNTDIVNAAQLTIFLANLFGGSTLGVGEGLIFGSSWLLTSNLADSNTGAFGNGEIMISNPNNVTLQTTDNANNQWLLIPKDLNMPDHNSPAKNRVIGNKGINQFDIQEGVSLNSPWTQDHIGKTYAPVAPDYKVIYYANTTFDGSGNPLGPNVAFTPTGSEVIHSRTVPGLSEIVFQNNPGLWSLVGLIGEGILFGNPYSWGTLVSTVTPQETAWINGAAPPHGYLWVANGVGQLGSEWNDLGYETDGVGDMQLYVYMCNSSFNPSTDADGVIGCGGEISTGPEPANTPGAESYREDFDSSNGFWASTPAACTDGSGLSTGMTTTPGSEGYRITHPLNCVGVIKHTLTGDYLPSFNGNTYTHLTMRIKHRGAPPGGSTYPYNNWWGGLFWEYEGCPQVVDGGTDGPLHSYNGTGANSQHAWLTREGTVYSPLVKYDYDLTWNPFSGAATNTFINLTWDLTGHPNWGSKQTNRVINAISIWMWQPYTDRYAGVGLGGGYADANTVDYTIDAIAIHAANGSTETTGRLVGMEIYNTITADSIIVNPAAPGMAEGEYLSTSGTLFYTNNGILHTHEYAGVTPFMVSEGLRHQFYGLTPQIVEPDIGIGVQPVAAGLAGNTDSIGLLYATAQTVHQADVTSGGGWRGPNNCTWDNVSTKGMWVQSAHNTVTNGLWTTT